MTKQIKELLNSTQQITIRWKNFNGWETTFKGNCYELLKSENIKITKKDKECYKLVYKFGCHKVTSLSSFAWLESDLISLVAMKNQYLGDKCKITSRFGTRTINF